MQDIIDQIKNFPHWMLVAIGLTLFGVYWKRSLWPNRYLKFVNLLLPTVVYPLIHYSKDADQLYWNPMVTFAIHGFAIGIASEFFHEGIVSKLKALGMTFPEEVHTPNVELSKQDTELLAKTGIVPGALAAPFAKPEAPKTP